MKKNVKWGSIFFLLAVCFMLPLLVQAKEVDEVEVVFTHDLHSHLEEFTTEYQGEMVKMGGFARIKTILDEKRANNPDLLVVDGGDFSMGTLYQTLFKEQASELRMLGYLGFDATTLGNHEFDYRSKGLVSMLTTAENSGDALPDILLCNANLEGTEFQDLNIKPYIVLTKGKTKIAIIGVFGEDALKCAPTCTLTFQMPVEAVKKTVALIQKSEDVDMIVCLSHGGTNLDSKKSEDEILAKEVPELDLIVSGHTHTTLEKPCLIGNTWIVSCGEYGSKLGTIKLRKSEDGRWDAEGYALIPLTTKVAQEQETQDKILQFRADIDSEYLSKFGYTMDQVLTYNSWKFTPENEIGLVLREETLGNILSDSYRYSVALAEGLNYKPVDVAIIPSGIIRDRFPIGEVTVANVFNISSLGVGADGVPGYPLISIYLTGKELKTVAEIDASIAPIMPTAQLYCSGLNYSLNSNRMILNKTTSVFLTDEEGNAKEIKNDTLYRVITDLYSGQMLSSVTDMSYKILSILPKNADGTVIDNFENCIVYDGNQELKAWAAVAHYVDTFDQIPEYYNKTQGRKIVSHSKNIVELVKNPNRTTLIMYLVVIVVFALLVIVISFVIGRFIRRKKKRESL
ncbi:MAG: bifunctional UDP-sugar hydrolase/5'-nucleotidase [Velocimicrobium sp.]